MILVKVLTVLLLLLAAVVLTLATHWRRTDSPWIGAAVAGLLVLLWAAAYFAAIETPVR